MCPFVDVSGRDKRTPGHRIRVTMHARRASFRSSDGETHARRIRMNGQSLSASALGNFHRAYLRPIGGGRGMCVTRLFAHYQSNRTMLVDTRRDARWFRAASLFTWDRHNHHACNFLKNLETTWCWIFGNSRRRNFENLKFRFEILNLENLKICGCGNFEFVNFENLKFCGSENFEFLNFENSVDVWIWKFENFEFWKFELSVAVRFWNI